MDYNSEEYLKLFKQIKEDSIKQNPQMLKETPIYDQYQNLNEVQRTQQPQNFNLNEFNIKTKINGKSLNNINDANPNVLNNFLDDNLNEVKQHNRQEKLNEILKIKEQERLNAVKEKQKLNAIKEEQKMKQQEQMKLNENINFQDTDYVTLDMFNRARHNSMMQIANRTINTIK